MTKVTSFDDDTDDDFWSDVTPLRILVTVEEPGFEASRRSAPSAHPPRRRVTPPPKPLRRSDPTSRSKLSVSPTAEVQSAPPTESWAPMFPPMVEPLPDSGSVPAGLAVPLPPASARHRVPSTGRGRLRSLALGMGIGALSLCVLAVAIPLGRNGHATSAPLVAASPPLQPLRREAATPEAVRAPAVRSKVEADVGPAVRLQSVTGAAGDAPTISTADPHATPQSNPDEAGRDHEAPGAASLRFDRARVVAALSDALASASTCGSGEKLRSQFSVTFVSWGSASTVNIVGPSPLIDTNAGRCVALALLRTKVPRFLGGPVTVRFSALAPAGGTAARTHSGAQVETPAPTISSSSVPMRSSSPFAGE